MTPKPFPKPRRLERCSHRARASLCALGLLASSCLAPPPPIVVETAYGDVRARTPATAEEVAHLLEGLAPRVQELLPGSQDRPVDVWVQQELRVHRFHKRPESVRGFTLLSNEFEARRIHLQEAGQSPWYLGHELVHALIDRSWAPLPGILEEGLADAIAERPGAALPHQHPRAPAAQRHLLQRRPAGTRLLRGTEPTAARPAHARARGTPAGEPAGGHRDGPRAVAHVARRPAPALARDPRVVLRALLDDRVADRRPHRDRGVARAVPARHARGPRPRPGGVDPGGRRDRPRELRRALPRLLLREGGAAAGGLPAPGRLRRGGRRVPQPAARLDQRARPVSRARVRR